MQKFILIEPAIEGWTGHYYEYSTRVCRAANEMGYHAYLAVNKKFQDSENAELNFISTYRMGQRLVPKKFPLYYFFRRFKQKNIKLVTTNNSLTITQKNKKERFKHFIKAIFTRYKIKAFTKDTANLFTQLPLQQNDVVFIPTTTENELMGLIHFFKQNTDYQKAAWHLLFHSDIYTDQLKKALHLLQTMKCNNVFFYTDTDPLTKLYNQLNLVSFNTLPIPIEKNFGENNAIAKKDKLFINYIGDARTEKGYHHLPKIINEIQKKTPRPIHFTVQSNFNIEEGEPAAVAARRILETYPAELVTLLMQPLSPTDYRELVLRSDIILLPYDNTAYSARSSGIFTEALVAGIPVIVPQNSWMSSQLNEFKITKTELPEFAGEIYLTSESISESLLKVISQYDAYEQTAKWVSEKWLDFHNPQRLLSHLFSK